MRYAEVTLDTSEALLEQRCAELTELGAEGFVIESEADFKSFLENNRQYWDYVDRELEDKFKGLSRIKCYLPDDEKGRELLSRIRSAYGQVGVSFVEDSDWENNWREYYKPIEVGQRLVVVPEWEPTPENGRLPLRLDPGLIFGTGSHATTRMCLAALENRVKPGGRVLDLGCGSGILGIGALLLGSESCVGVDIDAKAPDVVMSNAALNGIGADRLKALAGDILADASLRRSLGEGYSLVLANIVADVIIPLSAMVRQFMAGDGVFICSGIIDFRSGDTESALISNGFKILEHYSEEEWHCYVCE